MIVPTVLLLSLSACQEAPNAPLTASASAVDVFAAPGASITAAPNVRNLALRIATPSLQSGARSAVAVSGSVGTTSTSSARSRALIAPITTWATRDLTAQAQYTTTGGAVINGEYVAPSTAGTYTIVARIAGTSAADSANVVVTVPELPTPTVSRVAVEPKVSLNIAYGSTVQFFATASWSDSASRAVSVVYSATGGLVTPSGLFTAGSIAGTYRVIATCLCGKADTAQVSIVAPSPAPTVTSFAISPRTSVNVQYGARVQFSTTTTWSDGLSRAQTVVYSTNGGTISPLGDFEAVSAQGTYRVIAVCSCGRTDTAAVTVLAPQPPSVLRPNEPSGFTPIAENDMSGSPGSPGALAYPSEGILNGSPWYVFRKTASSLVQDGATPSPLSPGGSYRFGFPAGVTAGSQPGGNVGFSTPVDVDYESWYESGTLKIGTSSFETQQIGVKAFGYWGVGGRTGTARGLAELYGVIEGAGTTVGTSVMTSWKPWFAQQGAVVSGRRFDMNMNTATRLRAGVWHTYEILMRSNTIGSANGTLKIWIDGTQIMSYNDVIWVNATNPIRFHGRKIDPVWGGGGGASKSRDDFIWYDHVFVSGKR